MEVHLEFSIEISQLPDLFVHLARLVFMAFVVFHQMSDFLEVSLFHGLEVCDVVAA